VIDDCTSAETLVFERKFREARISMFPDMSVGTKLALSDNIINH
jgi:hypothetical protein